MGNILSRIQEIASNEGITIGALERQIGASKGVLSRAINNGTDIQSKWIQTIVENYPKYSARWLMIGVGSMLENNTDKQIQGEANDDQKNASLFQFQTTATRVFRLSPLTQWQVL